MSALMLSQIAFAPVLARIGTEYIFFGAAGLISVVAFAGLILAPALGSFSRGWEKLAAGVLSLFVLAALVLVGLAIGFFVFYNWDSIG
jgi:glucan phosphoethanolaminetransferase (alkaline phosphatase superfamily)